MKDIKEVLGIYNHLAINRAAKEAKGIASGAGVETKKHAQIKAQRGKINLQAAGLRIVSEFLEKMYTAEEKEEAFAYAGIATRYANAMKLYGFITAEELQDVIEVIEQAGEKAASRIEAAKRPFLMRAIKKVVRI